MSKVIAFSPRLNVEQMLLPSSPSDWQPVNHLVFLLLELIEQEDLDPVRQI
jgi:hypothetical protein